ncbi:MAG: DUF1844 domain-containing protein [Acidobacteriota bacterium]
MFTPDGELREEYRSLERAEPAPARPDESAASEVSAPPAEPVEAAAPVAGEAESGSPEIERTDPAETQAFMELVAMLAEPAAMFLGDMPLPDGRVTQNLEMARMHIDLLEVLAKKTRGNLNLQEKSALEDVQYRLRSRFVEKQG